MAYNRMTDVINKIERRLGTKPLGLPPELAKDKWASEVIIPDTLSTFSRYFPHMIRVLLTKEDQRGDYYLLDRHIPENYEILGVKDLMWEDLDTTRTGVQQYGTYVMSAKTLSFDDMMLSQQYANIASLFNNNVYVEYVPPNMVRVTMNMAGQVSNILDQMTLGVFVKHPSNLMTIEPTKMETFERLATADVALWLYEYLKHFDGIETVFANIDLKLSSLEQQASRREEIVQFLQENYVNPANGNQPIMYTV